MTKPLTQKTHKRFSASAMDRIVNCPRSVVLGEGVANTTSQAAEEGTTAHALADVAFDAYRNGGKLDAALASQDPSWQEAFETYCDRWNVKDPESVIDEMVDHVQVYLDYCRALIEAYPDAEWTPEQQLSADRLHPDVGGTTDFRLYSPSRRFLAVVDFKYGKGKAVTVEENAQALTYALLSVMSLHNRGVDDVLIAIAQPRIFKEVRTWETDRLTVLAFGKTILDAVSAADNRSTPLNPGGWCTFCPVRPTCAAYRTHAIGDVLEHFGDAVVEDGIPEAVMQDPTTLSPRQLRRVLALADTLRDWLKAVDEFAYKEAVAGRIPPGMKLVDKRGRRYYTDEAMAKKILLEAFNLSVDEVLPRKMVSVAVAEKLVGKKLFAERKVFGGDKALADYTVKKSSGYNLVPEDDPRPSVVRASAADEFVTVET